MLRAAVFERACLPLPHAQPDFPAMSILIDIIWLLMLVVGIGCSAMFFWVMWRLLFAPHR